MIWYLIYFCIVLIFYIIFWVNLIRGGELFEKKAFRISSIIIIIPFFLIFLWKTSEFTIQPIYDYIHKPPQTAKVLISNNSNSPDIFTFFVRRKNMEHWIPAYPRNNFSKDLYAFSHLEIVEPSKSNVYEFNFDTSKIDRIITVKIADKMKFTAGTMQALAHNLSIIPIQLYSSDFNNNFINRIRPNLNYESLMLMMFFVGLIASIYHFFIAWENMILRIALILLNLSFAILSGYFIFDLVRYFLHYIKIF